MAGRWRSRRPIHGSGSSARLAVLMVASVTLGTVVIATTATQSSRSAVLANRGSVAQDATTYDGSILNSLPNASLVESSIVTIESGESGYVYMVNGSPEPILGMGYDADYHALSLEERIRIYDRDFGAMKSMGANTVAGWHEEEFDRLTLDQALAHGLGVILPYYLPPNAPYSQREFGDQVIQDVVAWASRYKDHPALRMWGLGNEVMLGILPPETPQAFTEFYVRLIDAVHRLDPHHPIIYREADDDYIPIMAEALARDGIDRPWLVWGTNVYSMSVMDRIVQSWPSYGLAAPLVISEFAPDGYSREARPHGYREMWLKLRSRPEMILGGFPYVWATNGRDPLNPVFGLVDPDGKPTDGSLAALMEMFLRQR